MDQQIKINTQQIIEKYYTPGTEIHEILMRHNKAVVQKALSIAKNLQEKTDTKINLEFLEEAAMLHDIGIFLINAPNLKCFGKEKCIRHGILGKEILKKEGLLKHALVCERHIGVGITKKGIEEECLPLPARDMLPETIEEKIVCVADNFFSKDGEYTTKEKPLALIEDFYKQISLEHVKRLKELLKELYIQ